MVAAVGAVVGIYGQLKSASAQKKAMREQQKAQELADARERRKLLRATAIQRGTATNVAASIGGLGSTALTGGLSGLQNQAQSQLGFQETTLGINKYITKQNIAASNWSTFGSLGSAFSGFGSGQQSSTPSSPYGSIFSRPT